MKTAHRKASHAKRRWQADPTTAFKLLDMVRQPEPGELGTEHIKARCAFERLRDGTGDTNDFDLVGQLLNAAMICAEQVDALLVDTVQRGQDAMVRMQNRYKRGLRFGFDAHGLRDVPAALDVWEALADNTTKLQRAQAIRESFRRIRNGATL